MCFILSHFLTIKSHGKITGNNLYWLMSQNWIILKLYDLKYLNFELSEVSGDEYLI